MKAKPGYSARALLMLCDSKNKPPAMQGEGRSLDISNLLC